MMTVTTQYLGSKLTVAINSGNTAAFCCGIIFAFATGKSARRGKCPSRRSLAGSAFGDFGYFFSAVYRWMRLSRQLIHQRDVYDPSFFGIGIA
jgi:hypothetical protein